MHNLLKIFLTLLIFSFQTGCGSSDSPKETLENILNKDSVALADLSQHDITYEKNSDGSTQTDRYCPNNVLKNTSDTIIGTWSVSGNDLSLNSGRTYMTSNATLEKNVTYDTESTETYKVIKIAETVCLVILD